MRLAFSAFTFVTVLVLGSQPMVLAQWTASEVRTRGMFGDRTLGQPLKPRPSRFRSGLARGPSGNFLGRSEADRGLTFRLHSLPPKVTPPVSLPPRVPVPVVEVEPILPVERPIPEPVGVRPEEGFEGIPETEGLENPPDTWFRSQPPLNESGSAAGVPQAGPITGNGPRYVPPLANQYAIGFDQGGPEHGSPEPRLSARITKTLGVRKRSSITVLVERNTATLRGVVATPHDRTLAGYLILLEPGIRRVNNELTVQSKKLPSGGRKP